MNNDACSTPTLTPDAPVRDSRPVRWFWRALLFAGLCGALDTILLCTVRQPTSAVLLPGCAGGGILFLCGVKRLWRRGRPLLPRHWNSIFWSMAGLAATAGLAAIATLAIGGAAAKPAPEASVMVILGAGLWGREPSPTLQRRLATAVPYLQAHPQLPVIVSGGQGPGEERPEADAMREYLLANRIAPDRIRCESASKTTWENFVFTRQLLEADPGLPSTTNATSHQAPSLPPVLIVTSGFHMLRAQYLAHRAGFSASGLSAPAPREILPNLYGRELVAFVKSYLLDHH